jgi:hypothetical protein
LAWPCHIHSTQSSHDDSEYLAAVAIASFTDEKRTLFATLVGLGRGFGINVPHK